MAHYLDSRLRWVLPRAPEGVRAASDPTSGMGLEEESPPVKFFYPYLDLRPDGILEPVNRR